MHSNQPRPVPTVARAEAFQRTAPDWESIRLFLEVARRGSFRAAAESSHTTVNLLRRRIIELERTLDVKLLTRHVNGVRVTAEGHNVLKAAGQMEVAAYGFARAGEKAKPLEGKVRVAVTEGLGTFWVVPRLIEFQRAYPRLLMDLSCAMKSADVLRLEADLSIQLERPTAPDLKVVRLGRMHISLFASQSYIETYGYPKNRDDLLKHRMVFHIADQTMGQQYYDKLFPGVPQTGFVAMVNNVSSAHYWSIAKGAGIGWLPTYAAAIGARVVPVNIDLVFPYDIWLAYHPEAAQIPRIRKTIDWVISAFDAREFPWFRNEFIHPDELSKHYHGAPLANMFEGFAGTSTPSPPTSK